MVAAYAWMGLLSMFLVVDLPGHNVPVIQLSKQWSIHNKETQTEIL